MVVAGANVHDTKLLRRTLENLVVARPDGPGKAWENLCLDKGYDNPTGRAAVSDGGYQAHIRRIGEEEARRQWGEALPSAAVGGGADIGLAVEVPGYPGSLRQKGVQLRGPDSTGLRPSSGTAVSTNCGFEIVSKCSSCQDFGWLRVIANPLVNDYE